MNTDAIECSRPRCSTSWRPHDQETVWNEQVIVHFLRLNRLQRHLCSHLPSSGVCMYMSDLAFADWSPGFQKENRMHPLSWQRESNGSDPITIRARGRIDHYNPPWNLHDVLQLGSVYSTQLLSISSFNHVLFHRYIAIYKHIAARCTSGEQWLVVAFRRIFITWIYKTLYKISL